MPCFSCYTCGAQYEAASEPPSSCLICADDRQYVPPSGQQWTTREELVQAGNRNVITQVEPGVHSITVEPKVGIGQQALLIQTRHGNVLWDCLGFLHPEFPSQVAALGGAQAIAISHPHFYTACVDWADAFGCPVYLAAADRQWVTRYSPHLEFWAGDSKQLWPGVELVRLGGHFPGSSVLVWSEGCNGKGALFAGDTLFPTPNRRWVSLMYSFPNLVPLPAEQVARIGAAVASLRFDRLYGAFPGTLIESGAGEAVQRSVRRYCGVLEGNVRKQYF